jgi:hypothetical protein
MKLSVLGQSAAQPNASPNLPVNPSLCMDGYQFNTIWENTRTQRNAQDANVAMKPLYTSTSARTINARHKGEEIKGF